MTEATEPNNESEVPPPKTEGTPLTHTGKDMTDNLTGDDGNASWDPERWDTSQYHEDCQKCGATLHISGALGHVSAACPECNVLVYSL